MDFLDKYSMKQIKIILTVYFTTLTIVSVLLSYLVIFKWELV